MTLTQGCLIGFFAGIVIGAPMYVPKAISLLRDEWRDPLLEWWCIAILIVELLLPVSAIAGLILVVKGLFV